MYSQRQKSKEKATLGIGASLPDDEPEDGSDLLSIVDDGETSTVFMVSVHEE